MKSQTKKMIFEKYLKESLFSKPRKIKSYFLIKSEIFHFILNGEYSSLNLSKEINFYIC